ncbi:uncharacterized protein LOC107047319 [Diachasma alloeum]|uniref:uncharacterized protein LOC107047319 n=1 Tax=Diachasma alloeum TaxID=454923 RepID=UPI0007383D6B|nr:uncharacterized protein LOC107047319 [Diachasma alloeum]
MSHSCVGVITGWISALDPRPTRANAAPPRVYLFRCIINNTTGRQLRVLFWEDMARTYENQLCGQIVTITRARIVRSDPRYPSPLNLMKIEISVQRNSTVTLHGPYVHPDNALIPNIPEILLANVGQYSGEGVIRIVGFIETALEQQIFGNAAYGSGAITDGHYRLVINIGVFNLHNVPGLGSHIVVQGTLRRNAYQTLLLQVPDMSNI